MNSHTVLNELLLWELKSKWTSKFSKCNCRGQNPFDFLTCRWCATYHWKALDKCYNFATNLISIGGLHAKLWAPKALRVSNLGQNDIWVLVPWPGIEYIIREKVLASPKFGPWWVLWVRVCSWFIHAQKCYNYALTNLLFGLCRSVWMIKLLLNLPSFILKVQHALLPSKCCEPRNVPQLFSFWCLHP